MQRSEIEKRIVGKKHFAVKDITKWVNDILLIKKVEERGTQYSETQVRAWMNDEGFTWNKHKKTVYLDGHNRTDVKIVCIFVFVFFFINIQKVCLCTYTAQKLLDQLYDENTL